MRIGEIARRGVVGVQVTEPMAEAARKMASEDVGSLVAYEGQHATGIITERDVVRAYAQQEERPMGMVRDYMTTEPAMATPSDDSVEVAIRMIELGVRHLPIVEFGEPVGMVSARDLLELEVWPRIARR